MGTIVNWRDLLINVSRTVREDKLFQQFSTLVVDSIPEHAREASLQRAAMRHALTTHTVANYLLQTQGEALEAELPVMYKIALAHHTHRCKECCDLAEKIGLSLAAPHPGLPPFPPLLPEHGGNLLEKLF